MTQDEIIRMAREAGFKMGTAWYANTKELERFAALVREDEREKQKRHKVTLACPICAGTLMDDEQPFAALAACNWTQDYDDAEHGAWKTGCDSYWYIVDGKPSENGMNFCHGCGKTLVEHPYVDTEDEE